MRRLLVCLLFIFMTTLACSLPGSEPSEAKIQTAVAQTNAAAFSMQTALAGTQSAISGSPTQQGTQNILPTAEQITDVPTFDIEQDGMRISYDEAQVGYAGVQTMPAQPPEMLEWSGNPQYIALTFTGLVGELGIYPVAEYKTISTFAQEQLDDLAFFLENKPAVAAWGCIPTTYIECGHQEMRIEVTYFTFQNGQGVRSVVVFAYQDWAAVNNDSIMYSFEGLTADGRYYVRALFELDNTALPGSEWDIPQEAYTDDSGEAFRQYISQKEELLLSARGSYTPALEKLDALLQSLKIE